MNLNEYFEKLVRDGRLENPIQIRSFQGEASMVERLKEMGFHEGLEIQVAGYAPFGGPLLFRFGNTVLALRREEASCLLI